MVGKWTEPAKYGPTADYGGCEAADRAADARVTCIECQAHVCLAHADHPLHRNGSSDR